MPDLRWPRRGQRCSPRRACRRALQAHTNVAKALSTPSKQWDKSRSRGRDKPYQKPYDKKKGKGKGKGRGKGPKCFPAARTDEEEA